MDKFWNFIKNEETSETAESTETTTPTSTAEELADKVW